MTLSRRRWLIAGALFASLTVGSFAFADVLRYATAPTRIEIEAILITSFDNRDPLQMRFGDLEFRGGLALTSKNPAFGGISAIHVEEGGDHFIAITDRGSWLRGRIVYRDGKPAGITDAEIAPILGSDGSPFAARGWYDVESLAARDGMLYIGIERVQQIVRFDYRRNSLLARGQPIQVPPDFKTFTNNKSLECLAAPQQGSPLASELIAVTEHSLDSAGNLRSFLLGSDRVTRFSTISPTKSTTWKVLPCTVPRAAKLSSRWYRTTIFPLSSAICCCSLRWWGSDAGQPAKASRFFTIWRLSSSIRGASSSSLALRRNASSPPRWSTVLSALADIRNWIRRPRVSEINVTLRRFGRNLRLVLMLEWLTLWPTSGFLPVRSQRHDIAKSSKNIGASTRRFLSIFGVKMAGRIESRIKGVKLSNWTQFNGFSSL